MQNGKIDTNGENCLKLSNFLKTLILMDRLLAERQMYDEAKEKKEQMEEFRVEVRTLTTLVKKGLNMGTENFYRCKKT